MRVLARIAYDWGCRCFGVLHMQDRKVRALGLVEEAIELAQAVDVPQEQIEACAKIVYERKRDLSLTGK
jgi:hypothetical protein